MIERLHNTNDQESEEYKRKYASIEKVYQDYAKMHKISQELHEGVMQVFHSVDDVHLNSSLFPKMCEQVGNQQQVDVLKELAARSEEIEKMGQKRLAERIVQEMGNKAAVRFNDDGSAELSNGWIFKGRDD